MATGMVFSPPPPIMEVESFKTEVKISDNTPCTEVTLTNIQLKPHKEGYHMYDPFCWQTFGQIYTPTVPPLDCLRMGKPTNNQMPGDDDVC